MDNVRIKKARRRLTTRVCDSRVPSSIDSRRKHGVRECARRRTEGFPPERLSIIRGGRKKKGRWRTKSRTSVRMERNETEWNETRREAKSSSSTLNPATCIVPR